MSLKAFALEGGRKLKIVDKSEEKNVKKQSDANGQSERGAMLRNQSVSHCREATQAWSDHRWRWSCSNKQAKCVVIRPPLLPHKFWLNF